MSNIILEEICPNCKRLFAVIDEHGNHRKFCCHRCSSEYRTKPIEDRFWKNVNKNGPIPGHAPHLGPCWVWIAYRMPHGYGQIGKGAGGGMMLAHRVSWVIHFGQIPEGKEVAHKCDNRACVRPDHLWLATHTENMDDMFSKGRHRAPGGEDAGGAKLNWQEVREIRRMAIYATQASIIRQFGLNKKTVSAIVHGRSWKE